MAIAPKRTREMNGKQLRNSVLQLAISGKLVPQDPADEPASELLRRINPKAAPLPPDDAPFPIPNSWEWTRMQDVIDFVNGRAYKREELLDRGKYKILRVGNFFTNNTWYYSDLELPDNKYCYKGDLLYAWSASFGPQIWNGDKTIFHYHIWNVKYNPAVLYRDYLYYFFLYDKTQIQDSTTGSTMVHVSMENMKHRPIPLPPLEEQERIVRKLEELFACIERYDKAQTALDRLNASLKGKLRASILREAISGRLVPQDPNDEPAALLLRRINPNFIPQQTDQPLPQGWTAALLSDICTTINGLWKGKKKPFVNVGVIRNANFTKDFQLDYSKIEYLDVEENSFKKRNLFNGDLIVEKSGGSDKNAVGRAILYEGEDGVYSFSNFTMSLRIIDKKGILPRYLYYFLLSKYWAGDMFDMETHTTGLHNLVMDKYLAIVVPLPPLAEQKRIVAKVEAAFAVLDGLR